ncbi:MAG: AAA family ATPase [Negativicutes bacterium]|nr:AAA family ATPase [Negativicutes bacterium]
MDDLFGTAETAVKVEKIEKVGTANAQVGAEKRIEAKVFAEPQKDPLQILSMRKTPIKYTVQQAEALIDIALFLADETRCQYILAGYAGTGKTTIIENIINYANDLQKSCVASAPTNQAVKVLREKIGAGVEAEFRTLHSVLYGAPDPDTGAWVPNVQFSAYDLMVVDEGSMISAGVYRDLMDRLDGTGAKVIFIGDSFQLEPVGDDPQLLKNKDAELTEVKRQNAGSKILVLATAMRNIRKAIIPNKSLDDVVILSPDQAEQAFLQSVRAAEDGVYIVGTNRSRLGLNVKARQARFGDAVTNEPRSGDSLVCISNGTFLINGDRLILSEVDIVSAEMVELRDSTAKGAYQLVAYLIMDGWRKIVVLPDVERPSIYHAQFLSPEKFFPPDWYAKNRNRGKNELSKDVAIATYGYAITAHKSQGSQWRKVFVRQDAFRDNARWLYTAVTRATEQLILASDTGYKIVWESIENSAKITE